MQGSTEAPCTKEAVDQQQVIVVTTGVGGGGGCGGCVPSSTKPNDVGVDEVSFLFFVDRI